MDITVHFKQIRPAVHVCSVSTQGKNWGKGLFRCYYGTAFCSVNQRPWVCSCSSRNSPQKQSKSVWALTVSAARRYDYSSIDPWAARSRYTHTHTHTAPSCTWGGRPLIPVSHWLPIKQNYRLTDCRSQTSLWIWWCLHFPLFYVYGNIQPFLSEDLYFCRSDSTQMGITTA